MYYLYSGQLNRCLSLNGGCPLELSLWNHAAASRVASCGHSLLGLFVQSQEYIECCDCADNLNEEIALLRHKLRLKRR